MNILLVNFPNSGSYSGFAGATYFPLGVGYIASILRQANHNVKLIDFQAMQATGVLNDIYLFNLLRKEKYDLLCIGGVFFLLSIFNKFIAYSKEVHPEVRIVVGGNFATQNYQLLLKQNPQIDIIALGEGEMTILDIVNNLNDRKMWESIPGISFCNKDGEIIVTQERKAISNLDEIPFPARDLLPFDALYKKAFFQDNPARYCAHIIGSRGCPFHCIFCEPIFGRRPRIRSINNILSEIDNLMSEYNVKYFRFYDEMFMGGNKEKIDELCHAVIKNKLPIFWWCMTNGNLVNKELLKLMKESGCINISFGLEAASKTILKEMDKNCNLEHHHEMVKYCKEIGIRSSLAWLVGNFSETDATLEESKKYFLEVGRYQYRPTLLRKIIPIPGTRLFTQALETGKIKDTLDYLKSFEEMDAYKEDSWDNIPNLTEMDSSKFNTKIAMIKSEIMQAHRKQYTITRKIMIVLGLDHINWEVAFNNFHFRDIRPLFEAIIWAMLNRKNNFLRMICELLIYAKTSHSKLLKCEKCSAR